MAHKKATISAIIAAVAATVFGVVNNASHNKRAEVTTDTNITPKVTKDSVATTPSKTPSKAFTHNKICIAFYNVENLFDTIDQPKVNDTDFTPDGEYCWTKERYRKKIDNIAYVISQIDNGKAPAIIGLAEVETKGVLKDLINSPKLKKAGYSICHYDSTDPRGIDVAFLYKPDVFVPEETHAQPIKVPEVKNYHTRGIVRMSGTIDGELFHFMVAHWPSRGGGEQKSQPKRMGAAKTMRFIADSLLAQDSTSHVIMMGDFNDNPVDISVTQGLRISRKSGKKLKATDLFTPMLQMYENGQGSVCYQRDWNLFDIMLVNGNLMNSSSAWKLYKEPSTSARAFIFKRDFLLEKSGKYKGTPLRTFVGTKYFGGYSDHLPVYLYLER